jgi:UDP-glucuronate 4-epimerase
LFAEGDFARVIHLAAQAGVRYSLENPDAYVQSNVVGFINLLEGCRRKGLEHLVFASTSSVYGANTRMPLSEHHHTDHPVSLYAATKKANEVMAHSYSHLFRIPSTGLRFFTVYGPWGRPDMALFSFTEAILNNRPIPIFNHGRLRRDFTYIDDIVEGLIRIVDRPAQPNPDWSGESPDPATSSAPYRLYNIGSDAPTGLMDLIGALEQALGREALKEYLPMQPGDVFETHADVRDLIAATGFRPSTTLREGVERFVHWYKDYFGLR